MAYISKLTNLDGSTYDLKSKITNGILYGEVDSTSTATEFTARIPGITEYYEGLTILLRNGVVTSASGFTIDINGLGGKPSYSNMTLGNDITPTNPTRDTTIFNINYAFIFVYNTTVVSTGCWICYRGYDANTNTLGYQLRTNSYILKTISRTRYYRLLFTSADNTHWVPANTTYDNSETSVKTPNQVPINPFGEIVYLGNTTNYAAEADISATTIWQQYTVTLGYSFNTTGAALTLTTRKPVYIKCAPQSDGSAIIDSTTPYVQELPSTNDGKIYILLGMAYSATAIELLMKHPVYYYKDGAVRLWTNSAANAQIDISTNRPTGKSIATINSNNILAYDVVEVNIHSLTGITLGEASAVNLGSTDAYSSIFGGLIGKQDIWLKCLIFDVASEEITCRLPFISSLTTEDGSMYVFGGSVASLEEDFYNVFIGIYGSTAIVLMKKVQESLTFDSAPTSGSTNPVTSGGVYNALQGKQDTLTIDSTLSSSSINPVQNSAIYNGIEAAKLKVFDIGTVADYSMTPAVPKVSYTADISLETANAIVDAANSGFKVCCKLNKSDSNYPPSAFDPIDGWYVGDNDYLLFYLTAAKDSTAIFKTILGTSSITYQISIGELLITSVSSSRAIATITFYITNRADATIYLHTDDSGVKTVDFNINDALTRNLNEIFFSDLDGGIYRTAGADLVNGRVSIFSVFGNVVKTCILQYNPEDGQLYGHIYDHEIVNYTFDNVPTSGSTNLVNSGTVYAALSNKADSSDIPTATSDLTNDSGFITNSAIANMQTTGNLVTSMSSSSTDTQYPSAKLMYDTVGNLESLLAAI